MKVNVATLRKDTCSKAGNRYRITVDASEFKGLTLAIPEKHSIVAKEWMDPGADAHAPRSEVLNRVG